MHPSLAQVIIGVLVTIGLVTCIWRLSRATDARQRNQQQMDAAEKEAIKATTRGPGSPPAGS